MKRKFALKLGLMAAAAILLVGCATSTPYGPTDGRFGYSEQRIEQDRYRVTFSGNSSTTREMVESFLLYRAAELTVQEGYDYFIVTAQDTDSSSRYYSQPTLFGSYTYGVSQHHSFPYYAYGFGWSSDIDTTEVRRYEAVAFIVMRHGEKPDDDADAYDAREVMANLGPMVESTLPH